MTELSLKTSDGRSWMASTSPALIIGPAYAGKSELAMEFMAPDKPTVVIGTADTGEHAFSRRLNDLKSMRPPNWDTWDAGRDLPGALAKAQERYSQILVDSVSQWLASLVVERPWPDRALPENTTEDTDSRLAEESKNPSRGCAPGSATKGPDDWLEPFITPQIDELLSLIRGFPKLRLVLVSSEVGAAPSPHRSVERLYRQIVGRTNRQLAQLCDTVVQVTAGIPHVIKN